MSEKTEQRKQRLLQATTRVLSDKGFSGVNVRAVAEYANVSSGSVLYHFDTFDHLVDTAVAGSFDEFILARQRAIREINEPVQKLKALIHAGIPERISDDLKIVYEASTMLQAKPVYRRHVAVLSERQKALYQSVIDSGTHSQAFTPAMPSEVIAANIVALEDAYDLYLLDPDNRQREQYLRNTLLFAQLALGCELITD